MVQQAHAKSAGGTHPGPGNRGGHRRSAGGRERIAAGGIRGVRIEHCKFTGARTYALCIKTRVGRGAFIEDIAADDLDVSGMNGGFLSVNGLSSGLQDEFPVPGEEGIPALRNFRFSNCRQPAPRLQPGR